MPAPRLVKLAEAFKAASQWALRSFLLGLLLATPPQFVRSRIQEDGWNGSGYDQPGILLLHESPTAEGDNSLRSSFQFPHQFL